MKKVIAIFEIPDDETIDKDVIPKLTHGRITVSGANLICSTPVEIIDDQLLVQKIIEENNKLKLDMSQESQLDIDNSEDIFIVDYDNNIIGLTERGKSYHELVIPSQIDGIPVKGIGDGAFLGYGQLISVVIPYTITEIGSSAFQSCTKLESVIIDSNIDVIRHNMFKGCKSLKFIHIPDTVTVIEGHAFDGCTELTSITIPKSVTAICGDSFKGCTSLERLNYKGTEDHWNAIKIIGCNDNLLNVEREYNYELKI